MGTARSDDVEVSLKLNRQVTPPKRVIREANSAGRKKKNVFKSAAPPPKITLLNKKGAARPSPPDGADEGCRYADIAQYSSLHPTHKHTLSQTQAHKHHTLSYFKFHARFMLPRGRRAATKKTGHCHHDRKNCRIQANTRENCGHRCVLVVYFLRTPSRAPYRTPSACANRAAYPPPPPVVPDPESIDAQASYR